MEIALSLFLLTYIALLIFSNYKAWIALGVACLFIILEYSPLTDVFSSEMNWNVFMIIAGTMIVVSQFIESGMPALLADWMMRRVSSTKWAIILLATFADL